MYNKLFTDILDSSIWLEPTPTRLVWLTFIAVMDEDGYAHFAGVGNIAHRARVSMEEAQAAVDCLEGPDPGSSDPANEGRRIERVPGGWMVLNAGKYREIVTRIVAKEANRTRVRRFREKAAAEAAAKAKPVKGKKFHKNGDPLGKPSRGLNMPPPPEHKQHCPCEECNPSRLPKELQ